MIVTPPVEVLVRFSSTVSTQSAYSKRQASVTGGHSYAPYEPYTWLHRTVEVEVQVLSAVSLNLVFLALADTPGGATLPWRQHAALLAPVPAAVLLGLHHVTGLSKEGRFSELSTNCNMESQLHCHHAWHAFVIVSLTAAHYYYPSSRVWAMPR